MSVRGTRANWNPSDYIALGMLALGVILFLFAGMQVAGLATIFCAFFSWTRFFVQNRAKGLPTVGDKGRLIGAWLWGGIAVIFFMTHDGEEPTVAASKNTDLASSEVGKNSARKGPTPKPKLSPEEVQRKVEELLDGERQMARSDVEGRLIFWDEIMALEPENALFSEQRNDVKNEVDALAPYREQPHLGGVITKFSGRREGFGNVLVIDITVRNRSRSNLVDFDITCETFGASGTSLGSTSKVLYERIDGRTEKTFRDVNMGFINPQTKRSECQIERALIS